MHRPPLWLLLPLLLIACDQQTQVHTQAVSEKARLPSTENLRIVAKVDDKVILMTNIDAPIQLKLFDLQWQQYQLRKSTLNRILDATLITTMEPSDSRTHKPIMPKVEIRLTPPVAPRITLPNSDKPIKGNPSAEIKLSLFCSYQSSHCARLQPELRLLEARYGQLINMTFYDLPQAFHRYGKSAANANLCAAEANAQWSYQAALYSDINQLNKERYLIIANQLGLDKASFTHCIDFKQYQDRLDADLELAHQLGLGNVPVLFTNGLYTKGPNTADGYSYYINQELIRLGLPIPSSLPLTLVSTSIKTPHQDSSASLKAINNQKIIEYGYGDIIDSNVTLTNIEPQRILLNNKGQMEFLLLNSLPEQRVTARTFDTEDNHLSTNHTSKTHAQTQALQQLPTTAKMQLSKHWLSQQLANKEDLAQHFHATEHQIEGVHLLKLTEIDRSEFYKTLGLKSEDVILQVNNQWVHEEANPLWDALNQEEITLLVMREGHPIRFDYKTKQ